jgi:DNA (cytosine-5)-methyltransferase 1
VPTHNIRLLGVQPLRPKFIDLCSGIGVGSLGFVRAGFEIAAAVDLDAKACAVYKENLGTAPIVGDLRRISGADILKRAGFEREGLPLLVGCPPCQGFSTLRRTRLRRGQRDARKSLLTVFGQRVEEMLPQVVILENVMGLTLGRHRRFFRSFLNHMGRLGYFCEYAVLDAVDYGTPQHRRRLVLIGTRRKRASLPEPTHSKRGAGDGKQPWRTVRDAIRDLPPLRAGQRCGRVSLHEAPAHSKRVLRIIRHIPRDGGGRRSLPRSLWLPCHRKLKRRGKGGAASVYGRMRWDTPSPTITTRSHTPSCGRFLHPTQNRGITLREAARLQSIPDEYRIVGSKEQVARWIGNAMPLDLAQALGQHCLSLM